MQTRRDAEIVDWIGRIGAASAEHVMRRFGMSRSTAYERLNSLTKDGLLEHHGVLFARPGMYTATSAGLRWQGLGHLGLGRDSLTGHGPSGRGTRRRGYDHTIHPSRIQQLGTGQAVVITPGERQRAVIAQMNHPAEAYR